MMYKLLNYPDLIPVLSVKYRLTLFKEASSFLLWKALFEIKSSIELLEFLSLGVLHNTHEDMKMIYFQDFFSKVLSFVNNRQQSCMV